MQKNATANKLLLCYPPKLQLPRSACLPASNHWGKGRPTAAPICTAQAETHRLYHCLPYQAETSQAHMCRQSGPLLPPCCPIFCGSWLLPMVSSSTAVLRFAKHPGNYWAPVKGSIPIVVADCDMSAGNTYCCFCGCCRRLPSCCPFRQTSGLIQFSLTPLLPGVLVLRPVCCCWQSCLNLLELQDQTEILTEVSMTPAAPSMAQRAFCSSACTILRDRQDHVRTHHQCPRKHAHSSRC
jgi:hypothetical protein